MIVNRLWQHHFGRGIVATPSDFGTMGDEPTHPELLDWLATELVARGWSLKAMHRLMVTSATYRQSIAARPGRRSRPTPRTPCSGGRPAGGSTARRSATPCSPSRADSNPRAGRPVRLPRAARRADQLSSKGAIWPVSPRAEDRNRRSLYVFVRRNLRYPFFEAFDRPDTNASCPRRAVTTIAPQALTLLNSRLARDAGRGPGRPRRAARPGPSRDARIDRAYRLALRPRARRRRSAGSRAEFLDDEPARRSATFCLALLNVNEFVYVD